NGLPDALTETLRLAGVVRERAERYRYAEVMLTLARGAHQPVALELALKLKETCTVTAEAFSTAEFAHGPVILVQPGTPVLALQARDATAAATRAFYLELAGRGAELILVGDADEGIPAETRLATPPTGHFLTDPATCAIAGYLFAGSLSLARGLNPDAPRALSKVTRTL
ncbi:MAG TPA: SIS domain-containing protein, partial [Deinococcales bacterium]|nr:SIS domain-containing protein [Deinococcales bacterium]